MEKKIKIRLQGHEKFALRDGWLNKGLLEIETNPTVFLGKEAPEVFGIGNNMVKSLKYWLKSFGLIEEHGSAGAELTDLGKSIKKYDLYFEDTFTLWLLHSYIAKNVDEATTWYMFFNQCDVDDFSKEQIETILARDINQYTNNQTYSLKSLAADIDVLLNMYGQVKEMVDPEDKNISPFAQLGLINNIDGGYSKSHPDRRIVTEWNILYELSFRLKDNDTVSIETISQGEKSISAIYQINGVAINELLDRLDDLGYIRVDRTAGLDVIYKIKEIKTNEVIDNYYNHR